METSQPTISNTRKAPTEVQLHIDGMTCTNCALGIERYLSRKGVKNPKVNFAGGEVHFTLTPDSAQLDELIQGIEKLGYRVINTQDTAHRRAEPRFRISPLGLRLVVAWLFTLPLLLAMWLPVAFLHNPYLQLALTLPVWWIGIQQFGRSAWQSLRSGIANMDVLITMGSSAAFFYSLYGLWIGGGHDYMFFETAASIISIVLLGNYLEHRAVRQTTTAIDELMKLQKTKAKKLILSPDGNAQWIEIEADRLQPGDVVLLGVGDVVPSDGIVLEGVGTVNESLVSGESLPIGKQAQSQLIGGTLVVEGAFRLQITALPHQTVLSQIIEMVRKAQAQKPPMQRLADRVSAVFVPLVVAIAVLTFLLNWAWADLSVTQSVVRAIAVLVISCPCAMGLAIPTAVTVALGKAAKEGILLRGADTLERLQAIRYVVFDKTGTLTTGNFRIRCLDVFEADEEHVRSILLAIEQPSSHPIARSITAQLQQEGVAPYPLHTFEEMKGIGMRAYDSQGNQYQLGSFRLLTSAPKSMMEHYDLFLLRNGELIAALKVEDEIKAEAKEVIDYLHGRGIRTVLLSGDRREKCTYVSEKLGIEEVYAEQSPAQKLALIERLSQQGAVAMVGDGINDAPSLSRADIGISLSNATQVAVQSAQIVLLDGRLTHLRRAFEIGKRALRVMKQNLFWAFFYNVLAIPIAAIGLLSPIIAAFAMACSDIIVVFNSLRLRWMK